MGYRAGLWTTLVVVGSTLLWFFLVAGIMTGPVQAQRGSAVSVRVAATVSPQAMPTKGQPTQQGKTAQNEQAPSWVTFSLLLIDCAVLLAVLGFMFWIGGLLPGHRQSQPAGWRYEAVLALLAMLAAVIALALQVFTFLSLPIWLRIALLALAVVLALAGSAVKLLSTKLEKERSWARQARGLLQVPLGAAGQLPRLSALGPYRLGVSPSRYGSEEQRGDDPYVSRRVSDKELDEALHSKRFVLVVGDSKVGKSRTTYEAATRLQCAGRLHDPRVLVPKGTDFLWQLLDLDPPLVLSPEPALLWLDDLTESALAALTPALLDRLIGQMIVLGTLTVQRHDRIMNSDSDIGRTAQLALRRATRIRLDAGLTKEEQVEAEQKYPREHFEAGIGEQLVAVDQLTSRYDDARQGANPHGWAVVQAAIDWTRMDVGRPIGQHELVTLCPLYLDQLRAHARHDDKDHYEALRWACKPVASHIALLKELPSDLDEPSYVPFDYLVAAADGQGRQIPQPILEPAWDKVFALVSPSEALRAAASAYFRQLPLRAQKILTAVVAENSAATPEAAFYLGALLHEQGDLEGAKAAYQQAIDSGDATVVPVVSVATYNLGVLLAKQGNLEGAKMAYQQTIKSGHAMVASRAALELGQMLEEQEDFEEAKMAYQQAIDSGHTEVLPKAVLYLGLLLWKQGDLEGAKATYQQAIDIGHTEVLPKAAYNLGRLLEEQGDFKEAKMAYQQVIDSGHPIGAAEAAANLALLLAKQGDVEGSRAAWQQIVDSSPTNQAPRVAVHLGTLLQEQGDVEGAKAAYQQALKSGDATLASLAAFNLRRLLEGSPPPTDS